MIVIERFRPDNGERYLAYRYKDGCFRVADPTLGADKKNAENQIPIRTESELVSYIRRGYYHRMIGEVTGQRNLIKPEEVTIR